MNEIDDETIYLLTETIMAVNKLQINSKFRETPSSNDSKFACDLDDDIFECRRYIVCCLCHVGNYTITLLKCFHLKVNHFFNWFRFYFHRNKFH